VLAAKLPLFIKRMLSFINLPTMMRIIQAQSEDHGRWTRRLFQQYADDLGFDLEFQGFRQELTKLPGDYAPPAGCILLAKRAAAYVGGAALRLLEKKSAK
jgi:hypothetical protein